MKQFKYSLALILALAFAASSLAGCAAGGKPAASPGVRTVTYAFSSVGKPASYIDANGNMTGYDVEVMRAIDALLPQYEFEIVGTTSEDCWMGTESGKYQVCTTNSFRTEAREKTYLFAEYNQGGNLEGIIVRNENAGVETLADLAASGLRVTPFRPSDGPYGFISAYNDAHPDNQIVLSTADQMENADLLRSVGEGRYDATIFASTYWQSMVVDEDAELHYLNDQLTFNAFDAISTWALFNKDEAELRDAYQAALLQLRENGTLSALSNQFFGVDVLSFCNEYIPAK